jgi:hypothetical protein
MANDEWPELARERIRKHPPRFSPLSNAVVDYMVVEMARGFRDVAEATRRLTIAEPWDYSQCDLSLPTDAEIVSRLKEIYGKR